MRPDLQARKPCSDMRGDLRPLGSLKLGEHSPKDDNIYVVVSWTLRRFPYDQMWPVVPWQHHFPSSHCPICCSCICFIDISTETTNKINKAQISNSTWHEFTITIVLFVVHAFVVDISIETTNNKLSTN